MAHPNEDLVRKGYAAFSSGDMETLGSIMTPDVVHAVPGNNLTSGEHTGQEAVFAMYGQLFELSDGTVQVDLQDVTAKGDDKVVSNHRAQAKRGDKSLDVIETLEFTIADGKITRIDETTSDLAAEDAFWV
ncbi:MAG TPA: nuclear transport factor 2 family protein [Acidimicrobiia bacterium]|nr:nuclear transport factor 2 family protein [Acidimicrobiia bacterium]